MNKLMGLVLCGVMGVTGVVGAQGDLKQGTNVCVKDLGATLSLSAKQKDALRKVANKYVTLAGRENGLKQEVLEQFQKEVATCVADDESGSEIKDGNKSNKVMWYVIGGVVLLVGGFIVYKLLSKSTKDEPKKDEEKSPQDKIMDALRGFTDIGARVARGEIAQDEARRLAMESHLTPDTITTMLEQAHVTPSSQYAIMHTFEDMGRAIEASDGTANVDEGFAAIQTILDQSRASK